MTVSIAEGPGHERTGRNPKDIPQAEWMFSTLQDALKAQKCPWLPE